MKIKNILAALVLIFAVLLLSGCAGPDYDNDTPPDRMPVQTASML